MSDKARRRQLVADYKHSHPEAGVYRIVNARTNRALLGSTANLGSIRGKLEFAKSTGSPGALDHRLARDVKTYGLDAFSLEILEVLEVRPEMTHAEILADLAALEDLWREKLASTPLY
ncbi:MAG: GIY-YIG nuclease family protein [Chloroflexi bacterium]|nr:GIY-YIG nuclease family protein [Chloroflexota bacterium]